MAKIWNYGININGFNFGQEIIYLSLVLLLSYILICLIMFLIFGKVFLFRLWFYLSLSSIFIVFNTFLAVRFTRFDTFKGILLGLPFIAINMGFALFSFISICKHIVNKELKLAKNTEISSIASKIAVTAQNLTQATHELNASLGDTSTFLEKLTVMKKDVTGNSNQVSDVLEDSSEIVKITKH